MLRFCIKKCCNPIQSSKETESEYTYTYATPDYDFEAYRSDVENPNIVRTFKYNTSFDENGQTNIITKYGSNLENPISTANKINNS